MKNGFHLSEMQFCIRAMNCRSTCRNMPQLMQNCCCITQIAFIAPRLLICACRFHIVTIDKVCRSPQFFSAFGLDFFFSFETLQDMIQGSKDG